MFSASCSPVKISGSKQINAIFITTYISGTVISFEKTASPAAKGLLPSPAYRSHKVGHCPSSFLTCVFFFFLMVQTNHEKTKVFTWVTSESLLPPFHPRPEEAGRFSLASIPETLEDGIA